MVLTYQYKDEENQDIGVRKGKNNNTVKSRFYWIIKLKGVSNRDYRKNRDHLFNISFRGQPIKYKSQSNRDFFILLYFIKMVFESYKHFSKQ